MVKSVTDIILETAAQVKEMNKPKAKSKAKPATVPKKPRKPAAKPNLGNPKPSAEEQFAAANGLEYEDGYFRRKDKYQILRHVKHTYNFTTADWNAVIASAAATLSLVSQVNNPLTIEQIQQIRDASKAAREVLAKKLGGFLMADDLWLNAINADLATGQTTVTIIHTGPRDALTGVRTLSSILVSNGVNHVHDIARRKSNGARTVGIHDHFHAEALVDVISPH